jgi:hypothetical protein
MREMEEKNQQREAALAQVAKQAAIDAARERERIQFEATEAIRAQ